jgi:hypothetical protein
MLSLDLTTYSQHLFFLASKRDWTDEDFRLIGHVVTVMQIMLANGKWLIDEPCRIILNSTHSRISADSRYPVSGAAL